MRKPYPITSAEARCRELARDADFYERTGSWRLARDCRAELGGLRRDMPRLMAECNWPSADDVTPAPVANDAPPAAPTNDDGVLDNLRRRAAGEPALPIHGGNVWR